jgi:very-short-patch-repair endonuclease
MNENFNPQKFINYNRGRTVFARKLRKNQTQAEKLLWERLRKDKLGVRFLRQKPLGPYIVDFYCAQYRLCIEIDGSSHNEKEEYDENRTTYLNDHHIRVIRFTNNEIESDLDKVIECIQNTLN